MCLCHFGVNFTDASRRHVHLHVQQLGSCIVEMGDHCLHVMQAFAAEAADQVNGGKVKEMPTSFTTKSELASILTSIIFLCGPIHSAVNFAQVFSLAC